MGYVYVYNEVNCKEKPNISVDFLLRRTLHYDITTTHLLLKNVHLIEVDSKRLKHVRPATVILADIAGQGKNSNSRHCIVTLSNI